MCLESLSKRERLLFMGTEYYLVDHDKKIYYFLGKGNWTDELSLSTYEHDKYIKKLTDALSNKDKFCQFLNEPYNKSGKVPQEMINKIADNIFLYFSNSKNINVYSDSYYAPPEDYKEVGIYIYELMGYYVHCGHTIELESLPVKKYVCNLKFGHEGCHKEQYKSNYEWT